ncbi:MAG: S8 family serine peptidase [Deltaproteobacteria bacterium]|nr:S8 family serine peptidase [Deltaproteobacteria bacterium]
MKAECAVEVRFQKMKRGRRHRGEPLRYLKIDGCDRREERMLTQAIANHFSRRDGEGISDKKSAPAIWRDEKLGLLRSAHAEILLRFHRGTSDAQKQKVLDLFDLESAPNSLHAHEERLVVRCKNRKQVGLALPSLATSLEELHEVRSAAPNYISQVKRSIAAHAMPSFSSLRQWHLAQIDAKKAWMFSAGAGVKIAVLDDGVDVDHGDLRLAMAYRPDASEERDQFGRDFSTASHLDEHFNPRPKSFHAPFEKLDFNDNHGTPCAGLIASRGLVVFSAQPTVGVAPRSLILPVRIFSGGGMVSDARLSDAIAYAGRLVDVISMSFVYGASSEIRSVLEDVAHHGRNGKGCVAIAATGNEKFDDFVPWPAAYDDVIGVSACTHQGVRASYANVGPGTDCCAPSSSDIDGRVHGIVTCDVSIAGRGFNIGKANQGGVDGKHTSTFGGTSAAAPQVAGIAALVLAAHPDFSAQQVKQALLQGATFLGEELGAGRVNAMGALMAARQISES